VARPMLALMLNLIAGPPNSARAGAVLGAFREHLPNEPLLVVPTADDAERFERELAGDGISLGGSVLTFGGLFGELARAYELPWGAGMSRAQRTWLARAAARRADPGTLARSVGRPGFAPALAELIEELESAAIDPATFAARAAEAGDYEGDLARLYTAWAELRDQLGLPDRHRLAADITTALRADSEGSGWTGRPVFLYGFDDLTREQLDLIGALSALTDVTVAVTFEDRLALRARATLLADLKELTPPELLGSEVRLETDPATTPNELLHHLERGFLEPGAERRDPGEGLLLLRAAGERAEAELVGTEVARLLADGVPAEEIAIVLRSPARLGRLWAEVLDRLAIPAAVEASMPLEATAVGRGLAALARLVGPDGSAEDLVSYLRVPGRAPSGQVDRLERAVRREGMRSAAEAEGFWQRQDRTRELFELSDLREAGTGSKLLEVAARLARMIAEYPVEREALVPDATRSLELRAAAEAERALLEVAELDPDGLGPLELAELLDTVRIRFHQGAVGGRVRILSPYRLRARRVQHLFVCALQDGEFPRRDPASPLLPEDRRGELGLPRRSEPEDEERYLFAICLSRPELGLGLSWRETDDEGHATARSPFVDEIRDLLLPEQPDDPDEPDPLMKTIGRERGPGDVVLARTDASSPAELARALAAAGRDRWREELEAIEVPANGAGEVAARLEAAAEVTEPRRLAPRDLRTDEVLTALGETEAFGGTTLEEYALCSYRWFVGHELRPQRVDPTDEPLVLGGLVHRALEDLYRERPGGTARPSPKNLAAWRRRARELVERHAEESDLPASDPMALAQIRRVEGLIAAFLADEAASESVLLPDPELLEAHFDDDEGQRPALELDGVRLHGSIDRVDVGEGPDGPVGLVRDYKLSREVIKGTDLEDEGKLQLQLYALALRRLWGIDPVGGVYVPLRGTTERRARGFVNGGAGNALDGLDVVGGDRLDEEEFEGVLERAAARASEIGEAITRGRVRRDPPDGECPKFCRWQTICRKERGMEEPEDPTEEEDEP
jgi:ATP-dependent helicase/DNAse subunit B